MIVLPKEITKVDFGYLLYYMYHGSVDVPTSLVDSVLGAAKILQVSTERSEMSFYSRAT